MKPGYVDIVKFNLKINNTSLLTTKQKKKNSNIDDPNWGEMNKSLNSTVVSCFSLCEWNESVQKIKR